MLVLMNTVRILVITNHLISIKFQGCLQQLEDNLEPVGIAIGVLAIIFAIIEVSQYPSTIITH